MTDIKTPEQRSRNMAVIKWKDTKPEMIVRKYLFSSGMRFRVQVRKLPGNPDIVLPKYKTVIFVNGCFWHGHEGCKYFRLPKSNVEFWKEKIERNIARDVRNETELKAYNTPRFSDSHKDGGMRKNRYLCGKEENQNGKTIEIHSSFQGQGRRGSPQGNRTAGDAGQKVWRGTLENHGMEERAA